LRWLEKVVVPMDQHKKLGLAIVGGGRGGLLMIKVLCSGEEGVKHGKCDQEHFK
jgi:hypothetical protein